MNPFYKLWFWLLIMSIVGYLVAFAMYETFGQTNTAESVTPVWIWVILGVAFLFSIAALVLYIIDYNAEKKKYEIAVACGEIIPEVPKPIECPKKQCEMPCAKPASPCQTQKFAPTPKYSPSCAPKYSPSTYEEKKVMISAEMQGEMVQPINSQMFFSQSEQMYMSPQESGNIYLSPKPLAALAP